MTKALQNKLISSAKTARKNAHAPYSNFAVGAAVLCENGKIFSGVNVENASFGLTICAERSAIFSAVSAGCRRIEAIAIVAEGGAYPCGACRQVIAEFADDNAEILIVNAKGGLVAKTTLGELLPNAFRLMR